MYNNIMSAYYMGTSILVPTLGASSSGEHSTTGNNATFILLLCVTVITAIAVCNTYRQITVGEKTTVQFFFFYSGERNERQNNTMFIIVAAAAKKRRNILFFFTFEYDLIYFANKKKKTEKEISLYYFVTTPYAYFINCIICARILYAVSTLQRVTRVFL